MSRTRSKTRRSLRSNPRGILKLSTKGHGFVHTAEGEYFVSSSKTGGAFDGDLVELAVLPQQQKHAKHKEAKRSDKRPSARVIRVLERAHELLIGRYEIAEPFGVVVPLDPRIPYDIFTMHKDNPEVADGCIVKVRILNYPTRNTAATGLIEEVIGAEGKPSLPIDVIIANHKLETVFSPGALEQAQKMTLDVRQALEEGYRDITDRLVFTIDPQDARDFDDALSLEKEDGLFRLGVHIADVARYVAWGSSIDLDARRRATSVYLVDRVIPMLPEALSNELCSLKPHETRAVITVDMFLDDQARLDHFDIYPSLISSKARLSYEDVQEVLEGKREIPALEEKFFDLDRLAKQLAQSAKQAGRIDFITTEAKMRLDDDQRPIDIIVRSKTDATDIVEEAMILANTTVARYLRGKNLPCIYRVHDLPSAQTLSDLVPVLQEFDYLKSLDVQAFVAGNPYVIAEILDSSRGRVEKELVSSVLLRSMKRAQYDDHCTPHYGLALDTYCHFTSPIRRYPDLMVHRMLQTLFKGKNESFEDQSTALSWIALHSSEMERVAEAAARDSQHYKLVEYMADDVGNVFDAVISGVVGSGVFVRLENTAEGMVSVRDLGDEYFAYDGRRHILVGEESGKSFRLGEHLRVILERADLNLARLGFRLAYEEENAALRSEDDARD